MWASCFFLTCAIHGRSPLTHTERENTFLKMVCSKLEDETNHHDARVFFNLCARRFVL